MDKAAFQQRAASPGDPRRPKTPIAMSGGAMRCCIPSCANHKPPSDASAVADDATEPRDADCRFFAVPTIGADDSVASDSGLRRALWLRRIKKCTMDFDPDTALLCNRHFVEGEASKGESFAERARLAVFPPPQGASCCIVKKCLCAFNF
jgi:THAP domain